MPCPFAERKGALVYCKLAKKKVNPLAYPCLGNKYVRCKIYKKYIEEQEKEKEAISSQLSESESTEKTHAAQPQISQLTRVEDELRETSSSAISQVPEPVPKIKLEIPKIEIKDINFKDRKNEENIKLGSETRTRGLTLSGTPAKNCLECIYYGKNTRICLLLGVEVKNPLDPPCTKS